MRLLVVTQTFFALSKKIMKTILGNITGKLIISEDTDLRATVLGDVEVCNGIRLRIYGDVTGNVLAGKNSICQVFGIIHGNLTCHGHMELRGEVTGIVTSGEIADEKRDSV